MSVLSHLTDTASDLLTRGPSATEITSSISALQSRLRSYFDSTDLWQHFIFGSWRRDTNLPREADEQSDVDYMVVFKGDYSTKPQTLLDRLRRFVENKYSRSEVKQSAPTIVLVLNHIQFELVPAIRSGNQSYGLLQIPSVGSAFTDWQATDPDSADTALENHNKNNAYYSKPLVRLLKYWNCQADPYGRPFGSYELEEYVRNKYFYPRSNLKDYFYGAVEGLPINWNLAQHKKDRITRLKEIVAKTKRHEADEMPATAEAEIKKIIPPF